MANNCPLCRGSGSQAVGAYRRCLTCQTLYLSRLPRSYRIQTVINREAKRMVNAKQDPAIRAVHRQRLAYLEQAGLRRGSILDVGCGRGLFLEVAHQKGYRVVGLDKAPQLVAQIKRQGFPAVTGFSQLKGKTFDAVVAFDVIEHTPKPKTLIRQMLDHLKPGGLLMVTTPNAAGISAKILRNHWWVLDSKRHYVLFSPQALERCLGKLGLEVIGLASDTLTPWVMPSDTLPARLLNKLIYLLLTPLRNRLFTSNRGDNLQILARKPKRNARSA